VSAEDESPRIVLVEDNPGDVYLFRRALREKGVSFHLALCEDGAAAIRFFSSINSDVTAPLPDLIVLDLNLPKFEGIEVLGSVRKLFRFHAIPVAVLTSSESPDDLERVMALGVTRYLSKPTKLDEFLETVGQGVKDLLPGR
jgi:CheY-like chemotaxis protein